MLAMSVTDLFLLVCPCRLLLSQHHLPLSRDLDTLPQGLLQLLYALGLQPQRILKRKEMTFNLDKSLFTTLV